MNQLLNSTWRPAFSSDPKNFKYSGIRRAIWLYLILIFMEGALRKWILPGLATPLLIVRDPIAAFILFEAFRLRLAPQSMAFYLSFLIGIVACLFALTLGHGNPFVALYGARPFLLHFPAMFVIALALDRDDVIRMGKFILHLSLLMTPLLAWQFYSPQSAWINRGVAGEGSSAGFQGAMGYYRPPGTFSFTNGVAQFYSLVVAFLLYFWLNPSQIERWLRMAATAALILAIPLSVSRTLAFQCAVTVAFASLVVFTRPKLFGRSLQVLLSLALMGLLASQTEFFQTALQVMSKRFELASLSEGGLEGTLGGRYVGGLLAPFLNAGDWPFWGVGIGMGTNVGSKLLTGETVFLVAEGDWGRQVGELGMLLGFSVIVMRLVVSGLAAVRSWKALWRGDPLPWLLLSNALTILPQGSWGQPTGLGFSIMAGALLLASLRRRKPAPAVGTAPYPFPPRMLPSTAGPVRR